MQHVKAIITDFKPEETDEIIALLNLEGFDGFEETENCLLAYIEQSMYNEDSLIQLAARKGFSFTTTIIPSQNWNAIWESNFEPVIVDGFCTVRAGFHNIEITTPYEIVITPKMSFGTGHHATTQMMMSTMRDIEFTQKQVLDFGTGTGVLAILAEMLGASKILAIDNDEWSVTNAIENIDANNCHNIQVEENTIGGLSLEKYEVILANINRHILIDNMHEIYKRLNMGGSLLLSGILVEDKELITKEAEMVNFKLISVKEQGNWSAILFLK